MPEKKLRVSDVLRKARKHGRYVPTCLGFIVLRLQEKIQRGGLKSESYYFDFLV
jgi:hypothetical protein